MRHQQIAMAWRTWDAEANARRHGQTMEELEMARRKHAAETIYRIVMALLNTSKFKAWATWLQACQLGRAKQFYRKQFVSLKQSIVQMGLNGGLGLCTKLLASWKRKNLGRGFRTWHVKVMGQAAQAAERARALHIMEAVMGRAMHRQ